MVASNYFSSVKPKCPVTLSGTYCGVARTWKQAEDVVRERLRQNRCSPPVWDNTNTKERVDKNGRTVFCFYLTERF